MKYGSVCSGIEAASVAWHPLGWEPQWFSEIESFPSEVLKQRFPDIPNLGDMTKLTLTPTFNEKSIDLLVGGTPCQSFSVAGLRGGLADPRGNLMLTFLGLADAKKPKWIVWENVPGVLSSNGGKDFGTFLGALGELGYGFAYRVLDAQHFGVAQRRRRVFVVGYLGDWRPAAAVLFESESLQRNPKQSRTKRQETATDAEGSIRATGFAGNVETQVAACLQTTCDDYSRADGFNTVIEQVAQPIAYSFDSLASNSMKSSNPDSGCREVETSKTIDTTTPEPSKNQGGIAIAQPVHAFKVRGGCEGGGKGYLGEDEKAFTISAMQDQQIAQPIAVDWRTTQVDVEKTGTLKTDLAKMSGPCIAVNAPTIIDRAAFNQGQNAQYEPRIEEGQTMPSLVAKGPHAVANPKVFDWQSGGDARGLDLKDTAQLQRCQTPALLHTMAIRRLTPKECERLQGFPDDWTKIPYRNKPADQCPDGPRYKACGNSMAVPVMRWIGERIEKIEKMLS